ncbi:MAG: MarR family winged helix-turn-helix transcriptional regulator [Myxococcota bacterium]
MKKARQSSPDLGLFTTLARTDLFLDALQRECLGEHGLTFSEYSVLRLLQQAEAQTSTPSQLAEAIICTTGAMTKLVDRLERNALVQRKPNPSDRRAVRVEITRAGQKTADRAAETYRLGRERVLTELGEDQAAKIHQHLSELLGAFERIRSSTSKASENAAKRAS